MGRYRRGPIGEHFNTRQAISAETSQQMKMTAGCLLTQAPGTPQAITPACCIAVTEELFRKRWALSVQQASARRASQHIGVSGPDPRAVGLIQASGDNDDGDYSDHVADDDRLFDEPESSRDICSFLEGETNEILEKREASNPVVPTIDSDNAFSYFSSGKATKIQLVHCVEKPCIHSIYNEMPRSMREDSNHLYINN